MFVAGLPARAGGQLHALSPPQGAQDQALQEEETFALRLTGENIF